MSNQEKYCCNCLHCARWQTSSGVECHCDLTDRYLSYLDVMDIDNNCCRWEKETKWDIEKQHDKEIYNKAIDDVFNALLEKTKPTEKYIDSEIIVRVLKQLKEGGKNE